MGDRIWLTPEKYLGRLPGQFWRVARIEPGRALVLEQRPPEILRPGLGLCLLNRPPVVVPASLADTANAPKRLDQCRY